MTRAKVSRRARPSVLVRPIGPDQVEVRTACPHDGFRIGYQLGDVLTERAAVCAAIMHHHIEAGCRCMNTLWPRYKTPAVDADLDDILARFARVWVDVQAALAAHGWAALDMDAVALVRGSVAATMASPAAPDRNAKRAIAAGVRAPLIETDFQIGDVHPL